MANTKPHSLLQSYLNILKQSRDATLLYTSKDLHVGFINDAMLRILNKPRSVEGQRLEDFAPEFEPYFNVLKKLWRTGESLLLKESPAEIDFDGKRVTTYFDIEYQPVKNGNGETIAIINTARDVTDRMFSERLVKEKEFRVQTLISQLQASNDHLSRNEQFLNRFIMEAPAGLALMRGPELTYKINNEAYQAILPGRQIVGRSFFDVVPELKGTEIETVLNEVYYQGIPHSFEETLVPLSDYEGGPTLDRYFTFNYLPWMNENGKVDGVLNLAVEVTDFVRAKKEVTTLNEALLAAHRQLETATNAAKIGTWQIDPSTKSLSYNSVLAEIFGYDGKEPMTFEQAIGQVASEYKEKLVEQIDLALNDGGFYNELYQHIRFNDGKIIWLRSIGQISKDAGTGEISFSGVVQDVTEQQEEEQRKNSFIGMVSHELKTPLTSLHSIVQMAALKLKKSEDEFLSTAMDKAALQTKKMSRLIDGFLNISRLESGQLQINKQQFMIGDLVKECIEEIELASPTHHINLSSCDNEIVNADKDKVASVITNFISNAIKYSPKGTTITIECLKRPEEVVVSVSDEGIGIGNDDKKKLFDRYFRVQNDAIKTVSGFGIGLYLSAEIIKRHNGKIWVESTQDVGSTFFFSLPA